MSIPHDSHEEADRPKEYNETYRKKDDNGDDDYYSITVGGGSDVINWTYDEGPDYIIGEIDEQGRHVIYNDRLWEQLLRIIHHRINVASGTACLLNIRSMSQQMKRDSNIDSTSIIEKSIVWMIQTAFGISDPEQSSEDHFRESDDIVPELRDTLEFWGTLGRKTKSKKPRRRAVRVYQVVHGKRIMEYIEKVIPDVRER